MVVTEQLSRRRGRLPHHRHQGGLGARRRRHADDEGAAPATEPLPGYRDVQPVVFCGLFPIDSDEYPDLRDALEKLTLNDAALSWEPEVSEALGFGFRCGFLGLLHMDIVRERLEREYDIELMATMPSVRFEVTLTDGAEIEVHIPSDFPDPGRIKEIREPMIEASILTPEGVHRADHGALPGAPRDAQGDALPVRRPRPADLRPAAGRDRHRLLRRAEVAHPRLRVAGLRARRDAGLGHGQARHPARRRAGRRAVDDRAPRQGLRGRARADREAQDEDPAPAVRRPDPGRDRRARSSPARPSRPIARTSSRGATAATSRASASCSRSRRRARSA